MEYLRTVEEVVKEDRTDTIYCVAAAREWEYYDLNMCPMPISAWMRKHCPEAEIEPLRGFGKEYVQQGEDGPQLLSELAMDPLFRLGFTPEQAQLFCDQWDADCAVPPRDFYFVTYYVGDSSETPNAGGAEELFREMV